MLEDLNLLLVGKTSHGSDSVWADILMNWLSNDIHDNGLGVGCFQILGICNNYQTTLNNSEVECTSMMDGHDNYEREKLHVCPFLSPHNKNRCLVYNA